MSRKLRTLVVTLAARSFSSLEPAATFCLSSPAIVSLAALTAWVPGPDFAAGAAEAAGAGAGAAGDFDWATAGADAAPRTRQPRQPRQATRIDRRSMALLNIDGLSTDGGRRRGIHRRLDRGVPRRRSIGRPLAPSARASGTRRCRRLPGPGTPRCRSPRPAAPTP